MKTYLTSHGLETAGVPSDSDIAYLDQRYPGRRKALLKSWQEQMRIESATPDFDAFS